MSFETDLRERISKSPMRSVERDVFKVALGEYQNKTARVKATDEAGYSIVKQMIKANEENLSHLPPEDRRRQQFEEENQALKTLLPAYWSAYKIRAELERGDGGAALAVKEAKSEGQAVGVAMKYLKGLDALVEGDTVKQVVQEIRS